jgi:hypothetical protein
MIILPHIFESDRKHSVAKRLTECDKISFLSTNSAYNLRSSQIYSLFKWSLDKNSL